MTTKMSSDLLQNHARIEWSDDETPSAPDFGDVYYSRSGGLEETEYVFLQGNELDRRMKAAQVFTVGETGFGTGLNFLSAWKLWSQVAPEGAKFRFVSVEKHPMSRQDLERVYQTFPDLAPFAKRLLSVYPEPFKGWHTLKFEPDGVTLRLFLGEAQDAFLECKEDVNAWFLDGFAPAKNPDMWTHDLLSFVARMTGEGGTFSTFTAASQVRKSLESLGFEVRKTRGFGQKREMLVGTKLK